MPLSWECKEKFVKQRPLKPTVRRGPSGGPKSPGPDSYGAPQIFCGNGYSKIKRAPAFTFAHRTPIIQKPAVSSTAPVLDVYGYGPKGRYKVKHGVVSPRLVPQERPVTPGPGAYAPRSETQFKRPPAYSVRAAARPPYQPPDQWTPSPNMYLPAKPMKNPPAYSLGNVKRDLKEQELPSPVAYYPKFNYIQRTTPGFSFGAPFKAAQQPKVPSPNAYCEKKFMYSKRSSPAPSFGIRHSRYIGKEHEYLKSSKLNITISGE